LKICQNLFKCFYWNLSFIYFYPCLSWNRLIIKQYKKLQYFQFWRFELRLFLFLHHLNLNEYSEGRLLFKLNNWFERVKEKKNFECVNKTKSFVRQQQKKVYMRLQKQTNLNASKKASEYKMKPSPQNKSKKENKKLFINLESYKLLF
jgi:hypothetical protein